MIHDLNENPSLPFDEMNFIYQLDYALFETINNYAGRWPWLDAVARFFLNDYFVPTLMAVILLMLWFDGTSSGARSIKQRAVFVGALSAALANILLKIANLIYFRSRPFDVHEATLLFYEPTDSSLPSNAAALGFAIAAGVWIYQRTWGWALLIVALFFGLSRIFGGVHYPFDILAGAVLGCGSAWFIHKQKMTVDPLLHLIVRLASRFGLA